MNRRFLLALPIQAAFAAEGLATGAQAQTPAGPVPAEWLVQSAFSGGCGVLVRDPAHVRPRTSMAPAHSARSWRYPSHIKAGDYDSWYDAWNTAGDRLAGEADGQLARGHTVQLRGTTTFAPPTITARRSFFLHATPKDPRVVRAYSRQIETYKAATGLFDVAIEPVEIPYEAISLPGYFHRVDQSDQPRPLLIMHTGFDGSAEEMHWSGARAAVARGYHVLAFDGPGQSGPLHRADLPFRPDWRRSSRQWSTSR